MRLAYLLAGVTMLVAPAFVLSDGPPAQKEKDKNVGKSFAVPSRLTDSGHILVRAKINGKGPFNFIVDTGAPLVYVAVPVAKKIGIDAEKKGMTTLESFQVEGGPVHKQLKCVIETPFQLEGMNALGFAGVELHGIIGYSLLAHYKMEIDFTTDRMVWTKLDYKPPAPQPVGGKGNAPQELDSLGTLMKALAKLLGSKGPNEPALRGFIGMQLAEKDKAVFVESVLANGPAAKAGLMAGDRLLTVQGKKVTATSAVMDQFAKVTSGQQVRLVVQRGDAKKEITITAGEGL